MVETVINNQVSTGTVSTGKSSQTAANKKLVKSKGKTSSKQRAFDEEVARLENEEFKRNALFYITAALKLFTNRRHRLSIGQISVLINMIIIEYGETPKNRKAFLDACKEVKKDNNLSASEKKKIHDQIIKDYYDNKIKSISKTVSNNLKYYFNYENDVNRMKKEYGPAGETYSEKTDTLCFMKDLKWLTMCGRICKSYSKKRKCNVYWFESVFDDADVLLFEKVLDNDSTLSYSEREFIRNIIIMVTNPYLGALRDAEKDKLPYPTKKPVYDDSLNMEDIRYYLTMLDELACLKNRMLSA